MEMEENNGLGRWLKDRCTKEHLSLRGAAIKTGLSHSTIRDTMRGVKPNGETIKMLAMAFADGTNERLALEDYLLVLAGYRSERPKGEEINQETARLMDKIRKFSEPQLHMMIQFAEFLLEIERRNGSR